MELLETDFFKRRLTETIAWCHPRLERCYTENNLLAWRSDYRCEVVEIMIPDNMETLFRSPEFAPLKVFEYDGHRLLPHHHRLREQAVEDLVAKRAELLRQQGRYPTILTGDLQGGRLLGYLPEQTLTEGASAVETEYYLDDDDVPPWDSWMCYCAKEQYLVSWVPQTLLPVVSRGIEVNTSACLFWLDNPSVA